MVVNNEKIYKNALIIDRMVKLTPEEKMSVVKELLKNNSEVELARQLDVPRVSIWRWKTGKTGNESKEDSVNLIAVYRNMLKISERDKIDFGRVEMIRDICNKILERKK